MATAVLSDLHLGLGSTADVARRPECLERLTAALARADRVILLGDFLELRERRAEEVLEQAAPVLEAIGSAASRASEIVLVPGNHDYSLVAPALERARLNGQEQVPLSASYAPEEGELSRRVAGLLGAGGATVRLAYPGVWVRDDVFAMHGHYVDLYLTVPRVESVFAHTIARLVAANGPRRPLDAYEATLRPLYAFSGALAQSARLGSSVRGGNTSRGIWMAASGGGLPGFAVGSVAIPAATKAINALGLGPFRADISALELRRGGLRAMAQVIEELQIDAKHVIFGHTHRAGPLPGEAEGWFPRPGLRLHNTGNWVLERAFGAEEGPSNPYWPGRVTWVDAEGPPRFENVLEGIDLAG